MLSELFSIEYRYTDTQHNITQYRVLLRWYHSELSAVMLSESISTERRYAECECCGADYQI